MSPVNNNNMFLRSDHLQNYSTRPHALLLLKILQRLKRRISSSQKSADKKITSLFVSAVVSKSEKQFDDIICTCVNYVPLQQHCTVTEIKKDNVFWKESGP